MNSCGVYIKSFLADRIPSQLVIQLTDHCNANCPQCGMRASARFKRSTLPKAQLMQILNAAVEKGVTVLSFTGGEPLLFLDDLLELIDYARKIGIPFIRTGTNGFLFRHHGRADFTDRMKCLAHGLADAGLRNFWISLDSAVPQVHEKMRGLYNVVQGIGKAVPIFHAAGLYPSANLGINRLVGGVLTHGLDPAAFSDEAAYLEAFYHAYCRAFDNFYQFIGDLGFTIANTCYPMSIDIQDETLGLSAVYPATATERIIRFSNAEKRRLYLALLDTIPRHRNRLRIFTPLSALHMLTRQYEEKQADHCGFGCRGGVDFFFINAVDGNTFPCGYRGNDNMGPFEQIDIGSLRCDDACRRCDWECFRDPSEFLAPILQVLHHPVKLARRIYQDPTFIKLWLQDVAYYAACDFFDGRKPMKKITRH